MIWGRRIIVKTRKNPQRTCIVCKSHGDKNTFIRIVKNGLNEVFVDNTGKASGRGCYVCKNNECLDKLKKTHALNRAFKTNISEEIYDNVQRDGKSNQ